MPALEPVDFEKDESERIVAPVSYAQQRLWFLDQLEPGSAMYNMPAVFNIEGDPDRDALEKALSQIIERHQSLRAMFGTRDNHPVQIINHARSASLLFDDISDLGTGIREDPGPYIGRG